MLAFGLVGVGLEADSQRILLCSELINEITRVAPEGEVGVGIGGVEGGVETVLIVIVVVQQMGGICVTMTGR